MAKPNGQRGNRHWGHALFAASLAAWATFFGLAWFVEGLQKLLVIDRLDLGSSVPIALSAVFGIPVVFLVCFLIGIPALILAESLKLAKWWQAASLGAAVGALLAAALLMIPTDPSRSLLDIAVVLPLANFILTGAAAGIAAWASLWLDGKYRKAVRQPEA